MINIQFLVTIYFVSLFVDWIFQTEWQAVNKSKWSMDDDTWKSWAANMSHSFVYAFLTTLITMILMMDKSFTPPANISWCAIGAVLFMTHSIIDTRIPVKIIMRLKGMSKAQIADYQNYGFMHIGIDHRLHEAVLVALSIFVQRG